MRTVTRLPILSQEPVDCESNHPTLGRPIQPSVSVLHVFYAEEGDLFHRACPGNRLTRKIQQSLALLP